MANPSQISTTRIWLIWLVSSFYIFFQVIIQTSISVMVGPLMHEFALDSTQIGFAGAAFLMTYIFLQMPSGSLIDRFGPKKVLVTSAILTVIGCVWFASANSYLGLLLARLFLGLCLCPVIAGCFNLIDQWFPEGRYTLMVGLSEGIAMLGGVAGIGVLSYFVEHVGWRVTSLGCAVLALIFLVLLLLVLKENSGYIANVETGLMNLWRRVVTLLSRVEIWVVGIFAGLNFAIVVGFAGLWAVPFLQTLYQSSLEQAAFAVSMLFIGSSIACPIIGFFGDNKKNRFFLLTTLTLINLLLISIVIYLPNIDFGMMLILFFLLGFCASNFFVAFTIVRAMVHKEDNAAAMGLTNMLLMIVGAPLMQPLIGFMLRASSNGGLADELRVVDYQWALFVLPVGLVLALLLLPVVRKFAR